MLLFDADKRKGGEPKSSVWLRITVSLLLTIALLAYIAFEIFLIYSDGQDGFAVRTTLYTKEQYSAPDIVFCSETNPVMTYKCDTILTDGTQVADGCSNLLPPESTKYVMDLDSSYHYCYDFRVNGQLIFDQWNDSNKGVKSLKFSISVPSGQPAPDHISMQLFDPAGNFYANNLINSAFEDSIEIQAARTQNKYIITSGTQMATLYSTWLHQQLSKTDSLGILGLGYSKLTDQHFLDSSADKVNQQAAYAQQGLYAVVTVEPATYNIIIQQDQRRYTILTALGLLGGAYGAFASLFFFLFGEKQINPIGVVNRLWTSSQAQPDTAPMQQHNLLSGLRSTSNSHELDTVLPAGQSSQKSHVNFIETRHELTLEQRVTGIERLLNDYVVNLDVIGNKLGEY